MRAGHLDRATLIDLRDVLIPMLTAPDPQGFQRPFAALVLSEVARTDRVKPWMSADERQAMCTAAEQLPAGHRRTTAASAIPRDGVTASRTAPI